MVQKHELEITIGSEGQVGISVSGIDGPDCLKITEELEKELGVVVMREKTSAFYKEKINTESDIRIQ